MRSGLAKTLDKAEEKARKSPLASPEFRLAGAIKHEYGQRQDINTNDVGYATAKQKHEEQQQAKQIEDDKAAAQAAQAADAAAALEKSQASQRNALKRKGRRAAILTSSQGVVDPLGVPGS